MDIDGGNEHGRNAARRRRSDLRAVASAARRPRRQHRHSTVGRRREPRVAHRLQEGRHLLIHRPAALQVRCAQQPPRLLPPRR